MIDGLPYLKLPKIGNVRFVLPKGKTLADLQPLGVSIKSATVTRTNSRYRVSLQMETVIDRPVFPAVIHADEVISVDLGLKVFGMFGNAKETFTVPNPRWIKVHAKRLRRFQQSLSRKQYDQNTHRGSKNWRRHVRSRQRSSVRLLTREGISITSFQGRLQILCCVHMRRPCCEKYDAEQASVKINHVCRLVPVFNNGAV